MKHGYFWLKIGITDITSPTDHRSNTERRSRRTKLDEAGFWDALGGDRRKTDRRQNDEELTAEPKGDATSSDDLKDIGGVSNVKEQSEQRRATLLSMLHASEERFKRAASRRGSVLAEGVEVSVISGDCAGEISVIIDADYITNRVLVTLSNNTAPQWLPFAQVATFTKSEPSTGS